MNEHGFPRWAIDGAEITQRLRAAGLEIDRARPEYLRDKPGETAVIAYDLTSGDQHERGYLRWFADPKRADNDRRKALAMAPVPGRLGPGVAEVGDHATVRVLPNDARLRRARWYLTPRKLKRSLDGLDILGGRPLSGAATSVQVLTYKPERRVVARLDLGDRDGHRRSVLLRYSTHGTAAVLAATTEHLRRHGVATARPIAQLERNQVGLDEFLPGIDLRTAACLPRSRVADAVADQVAALHRVPISPGSGIRSRDRELGAAVRTLGWLSERGVADPDLAAAVRRGLIDTSACAPITPAVLVHGDLHDGNILVEIRAGDAPQVFLIDLERVSIGEAELDLGRLLAAGIASTIAAGSAMAEHRVVTDIAHRVRARSKRTGTEPTVLAFHLAKELVREALTAARRLEAVTDPCLADRLLGAAREVLDEPAAAADVGWAPT